MTLIVCCSGFLGFVGLKSLRLCKNISVKTVLTDKESVAIVEYCKLVGIPLLLGNPRKKNFVKELSPCDVLFSINYLFILPRSIYGLAKKLACNIHGSLLPKYMGRTPNTWVIIHDEVETGITVHEIVADCDSGPIVYQEKIKISNVDTAGSLTNKMARRYPVILRKIIKNIQRGKIIKRRQDLEKRIYCGKRDSEDGLINWNWSSRRVYNWVRAQTKPYPGAFFYFRGKKYILWWVNQIQQDFSDKGMKKGVPYFYNQKMYIKAGQGVLEVVDYEICQVK